MAQMVEHLPGNCHALNPSTAKIFLKSEIRFLREDMLCIGKQRKHSIYF
jgi:hypothetical protein